ncbi:hypothetical protein [Catellatospora citrea]|uniref:Secreted protein n=1 Tax=Catellatospora citrea TaxID=53366 RepID=A0A8J3NY96_9ACTN|nr:hypothetical protein [Catellatospora citrea]RKE09285.1 hypothetical protein C8E86_4169 [Catellatospora citrea]GIF97240.1 hypothetical protein Cci01nite_23340 [Catellatospora citrea]
MPERQSTQAEVPEQASVVRAQAAARTGDAAGTKLGMFVGGLIVALVVGFTLGKVLGPAESPTQGATTGAPAASSGMGGAHVHAPGASAGSEVGGLAVSSGGYTLAPAATVFAAPGPQQLEFVVNGADGKPVTDFAVVHDKPLHLVVVRRDMTGYQHLHPTMAADGTWTVQADLATPGPWRAYADFTAVSAGGTQTAIALGTDLTVAGDYRPQPLPAAAREAAADGLTAGYEGTPVIGASQPMLFTVKQGGATAKLEPYLGSFGHLVVLRELDLAYVHVHPEPALVNGGVKFWLAAPSPGRYRMFFDYSVGGKVRTAQYTLEVK